MPRPPSPHLAKPDRMFARSWEWSELTAFAADPEPGATLGVVSGRRRQGKTVMDQRQLFRLRHIRDLLAAKGLDTSQTRLACYSGAGFTHELHEAAARGEVVLVDLARLYGGT